VVPDLGKPRAPEGPIPIVILDNRHYEVLRACCPPELGRTLCRDKFSQTGQAVRLIGLSRSRIYELIRSGDLPVRKVGRATPIAFADLKRMVAPEE